MHIIRVNRRASREQARPCRRPAQSILGAEAGLEERAPAFAPEAGRSGASLASVSLVPYVASRSSWPTSHVGALPGSRLGLVRDCRNCRSSPRPRHRRRSSPSWRGRRAMRNRRSRAIGHRRPAQARIRPRRQGAGAAVLAPGCDLRRNHPRRPVAKIGYWSPPSARVDPDSGRLLRLRLCSSWSKARLRHSPASDARTGEWLRPLCRCGCIAIR